MIEFDLGPIVLLEALSIRVVAAAERFGKFLCEGFMFPELLKDGFMEEVLDVFGL